MTNKLDVDAIIQSILVVTNGALQMQGSLQAIVDKTAIHYERIAELSPSDAARLRDADTRMADALTLLGTDAVDAAKYIRESISASLEN